MGTACGFQVKARGWESCKPGGRAQPVPQRGSASFPCPCIALGMGRVTSRNVVPFWMSRMVPG